MAVKLAHALQALPLSTTTTELQRWHHAMCRAGQRPIAVLFIGFGPDPRNRVPINFHLQIEVAGRDYDIERDGARWRWMRQNEAAVLAYLQRLGSYAVCGMPRVHPAMLRPC